MDRRAGICHHRLQFHDLWYGHAAALFQRVLDDVGARDEQALPVASLHDECHASGLFRVTEDAKQARSKVGLGGRAHEAW
jgi:hypothetical protein